jgi:hypothetical protein
MKGSSPMNDETPGTVPEVPSDWCIQEFRYSLQALAQPSYVQLAIYPDWVVKVEELALDYDHWYACVRPYTQYLSHDQKALLDEIAHRFDALTGTANSSLWTEEALEMSREWAEIRRLAQDALTLLGWRGEYEGTNRSTVYIRGSET